MEKFLELHTLKGEILTVNLSFVMSFFPCKKGTTLLFADGLTQDVSESYEALAAELKVLTDSEL